jgi:hypothetical protein
VSDKGIVDFFECFEKAINTGGISEITSLYADSFLFGTAENVQAIKKEDFLKVLPKREGFFAAVGLKKTSLTSVVEEGKLGENYSCVRTGWKMEYVKEGRPVIEDTASASYILLKKNDLYQIVFQLDHQDLMNRVRTLGLI